MLWQTKSSCLDILVDDWNLWFRVWAPDGKPSIMCVLNASFRKQSVQSLLFVSSNALQDEDYESLFTHALRNCGILCIGLYRQIDPRPSAGSYNRYIITNPPVDFGLYPSDKVSFVWRLTSFTNFLHTSILFIILSVSFFTWVSSAIKFWEMWETFFISGLLPSAIHLATKCFRLRWQFNEIVTKLRISSSNWNEAE